MKRASFVAAAAAVAAVPAARAGAQSLTTIRYGTAAVESYALPMYAQEGGFFKKQGIDAEMTYFPGGGAVLAQAASALLDYASVNLGATANAFVKNIPIAVFAGGGLYTTESPTTILDQKDNTTIKTGRDLNGRPPAC